MKEIEFWGFIYSKISNEIPVILLVVANSTGSSPGRAGFKMALSNDEELRGTIGGGIMEFEQLEEARKYLQNNKKINTIRKLLHDKKDSGNTSGLICGGTQTMIIQSLDKGDEQIVNQILTNLENHKNGLLTVNQNGFSFDPNKTNSKQILFSHKSDSDWQYQENCGFQRTVYIIGGGHVGLAVSRAMSTLDFYVITFDPRKDVFTMKNNIYSNQKINIPYPDVGKYIDEGERSFVVIVTSEHDTDLAALKAVIHKKLKYLGMMGSKKKIQSIFKNLTENEIEQELLKRVHAPIGIELEAKSPEEIAISIAAEIIKVANKSTKAKVTV